MLNYGTSNNYLVLDMTHPDKGISSYLTAVTIIHTLTILFAAGLVMFNFKIAKQDGEQKGHEVNENDDESKTGLITLTAGSSSCNTPSSQRSGQLCSLASMEDFEEI